MSVNLRGSGDGTRSVDFNIPVNLFDPNHVGSITEASHLFVAMCFMYALKSLGNPETATRGNVAGMVGMTVAISTAWLAPTFTATYKATGCFVIAAVIGVAVARKAEMIMMPVLVAAFHAMVGLSAVLVAFARYFDVSETMNTSHLVETIIGVFFGALTLTGSVVAAGKLHGTIPSKSLLLPFRHWINAAVITLTCFFTYEFTSATQASFAGSLILFAETALSLFLGWHLVMSIGGADMPVIVSTLNSYSGWTTVAAGFLLENNLLIIAGSLIGSSGAILSYIMCKGMNRSFLSVILGGFGVEEGTHVDVGGEVTEINTAELAQDLVNAKSVIIVPGYGMAVSRCQQTVAAITELLRANGVRVRFAIHPVAGRLPGHMNVLLAEANVPYDIVAEMEKINDDFPTTDVSIVLGANDIVNPLAIEDLKSPIGGMPVLEVWKAKKCVVMKRSMATGYSGIDNPLFYKENVKMFFGNAKEKTTELLAVIQSLVKGRAAAGISNSLTQPLLEEAHEVLSAVVKTYPSAVKSIGVLNEGILNDGAETRVAISPNTISKFRQMGYNIVVERDAGARSSFPDRLYAAEGCRIADSADQVIAVVDIVVYIGTVPRSHYDKLKPGQVVIGYLWPAFSQETLKELADRKIIALSMDAVPRITRAQKIDSLSSMANLAGYRAVIQAFNLLPRFSKPLTTAAGQVNPATVFVIGAGVAGLSAIGTARSLGAIVKANDTRSVVKEQVESMGAEFVEVVAAKEEGAGAGGYAKETSKEFQKAQLELYAKVCRECDIVITTAQIPGRPAPRLLTKEMVRSMKPGSVCVDLAAGQGGNIELTVKDKTITDNESGVVIVGNSNLSRDMAAQASELYSANLGHLFAHMKDANAVDSAIANPDDVIGPMRCTFNGHVVYAPPTAPPPPPVKAAAAASKPVSAVKVVKPTSPALQWVAFVVGLILVGALCYSVGSNSDVVMINHLLAFVMAVIVGYYLVWSVDAALHTPLMSVTNAISGIIVLGGLLQLNSQSYFAVFCSMVGTFCAGCNIFGGFLITQRMLGMFRR